MARAAAGLSAARRPRPPPQVGRASANARAARTGPLGPNPWDRTPGTRDRTPGGSQRQRRDRGAEPAPLAPAPSRARLGEARGWRREGEAAPVQQGSLASGQGRKRVDPVLAGSGFCSDTCVTSTGRGTVCRQILHLKPRYVAKKLQQTQKKKKKKKPPPSGSAGAESPVVATYSLCARRPSPREPPAGLAALPRTPTPPASSAAARVAGIFSAILRWEFMR